MNAVLFGVVTGLLLLSQSEAAPPKRENEDSHALSRKEQIECLKRFGGKWKNVKPVKETKIYTIDDDGTLTVNNRTIGRLGETRAEEYSLLRKEVLGFRLDEKLFYPNDTHFCLNISDEMTSRHPELNNTSWGYAPKVLAVIKDLFNSSLHKYDHPEHREFHCYPHLESAKEERVNVQRNTTLTMKSCNVLEIVHTHMSDTALFRAAYGSDKAMIAITYILSSDETIMDGYMDTANPGFVQEMTRFERPQKEA